MAAIVSNPKTGEISMSEAKKSSEVVVMISGQEKDVKNSPRRVSIDSHFDAVKFAPVGMPSPEIARYAPSPNRPPRIPTSETTTPRKSLASLKHTRIWGLEVWKWSLLVMVTFSGMLFTNWFMHIVVLVIELNFLFKKKVLYFVHSLKKSVRVCLWLTLILITWLSLFNNGVHRSATATKVLDYITWTIVSMLICSFLWLFKTLLLKMLASSFHVTTFFDRVQESIFHQYVLQVLSGPPLLESAGMLGRTNSSQFSFRSTKKGKPSKEGSKKAVIDINKLYQMKQEKVSAWTMKMLVDVISNSGLSTISDSLDESDYYGNNEQVDKEITNEMEAIAAAYHIYRNVAQPGSKYIDELDLRRFMLREEVEFVFPLIDVAETGQVDRKALTEWVVKVYNGRKALAHALNDTKTAVNQLNTLVTVILIVIIIVVWLLLVEIATTKVLLFLSSQLVAAAFLFGNTCKTIFEAIIFVFVMHPFDVGDRCVIDGVQMIVEEMNILTTVFLRYDMEKIYYPNSILATKPISNFYRSPDMGDSLEFCIDFRTPVEKIGSLKEKIKKYLERTPQYWHPNHNMVVKEIENVNKIKMALFFNHTMNFQDFAERNRRRSELVLEMKKIFDDLSIKYNLLSQEVQVVKSDASR
ncbi:mechanosensitive ion channel protein 10 isoform X2 [Daucus carota subsp. sativus]|uniref:mechanosensitive ion channel protein 10 isoform X2 n=1 Tax=Daucus carota subsp. sativus TaxID=79200 RepID=UPI0030833E00